MRSQPLGASRESAPDLEEPVQSSSCGSAWQVPESGRSQERSLERSRKAAEELAVPPDVSRTPCPCNSDQLMEF